MAATIRDPIHGSILLEVWALPLVDSPVVQRLRRIQQLGTAHLVYPGARHSRFEHSLGAYHLAGRLAHGMGLAEEDRRTVQAAALLHDVGHGPFSHAFEELMREEGRRHEETTADLVRWGPLADRLRRAGLDPVAVADAVLGQGRLAPVVSGSLDADRMDYLLRDAHYTGVPSNVDPERVADTVRFDPEHGVLLEEAGLLAAEALLTTRFLMYPAVYLHHTVRASEAMLLHAVRLHVAAGHPLGDLERDTDDVLLGRLRAGGGTAADLVGRLDERRLWKRAWEGDARIAVRPETVRLREDPRARAALALEIAEAAGIDSEQVVLDVPHPPRFRELGLKVLRRDGSIADLPACSRLVHALQEARLDHWRAWVFTPARHRDAVARAALGLMPLAGPGARPSDGPLQSA